MGWFQLVSYRQYVQTSPPPHTHKKFVGQERLTAGSISVSTGEMVLQQYKTNEDITSVNITQNYK